MASFSPQAGFLALGANGMNRQGSYRALFRASLDQAAIEDSRLALNHNQPLGKGRFMSKIARVTSERREARPRGGSSKETAAAEMRAANGLCSLHETQNWPLSRWNLAARGNRG